MTFSKDACRLIAATIITTLCIHGLLLADDAPPPQAMDIDSIRIAMEQAVAELTKPCESEVEGEIEDLDALVSRCTALADELPDGPERLESQNGLLQTRFVQAQLAHQQKKNRNAAIRMGQLRTAAWQLKQHPDSPAAQVADRWLLQADLFDINRAALDHNHRQRQVIKRLEQFLVVHRAAPVALAGKQTLTTRDIGRALLRLYDQRGMCAEVGQLIEQIKAGDPQNHDRHRQLHRQYGYLKQIGNPLQITVTSSDGVEWRLDQPRDGVLLIAFWSPADATNPQKLLGELQTDRQGVTVLNALVGSMTENADPSKWPMPVCADQQAVGQLLNQLSVRSVPRMAIIDHNGEVASIGGPAIRDRLDELIDSADEARARKATDEAKVPQDEPTKTDEASKTDK